MNIMLKLWVPLSRLMPCFYSTYHKVEGSRARAAAPTRHRVAAAREKRRLETVLQHHVCAHGVHTTNLSQRSPRAWRIPLHAHARSVCALASDARGASGARERCVRARAPLPPPSSSPRVRVLAVGRERGGGVKGGEGAPRGSS